MKRFLLVLMLTLCVVALATAGGEQEYPARDITDIVVWGAGGGTDVCNRVIMGEMAKELGVNINVTNVTGGSAGSVGLAAAYSKDPDGYTLCGLSESNTTTAVMVEDWDHTVDIWDFFIVGGSPEVVSVTPDLPYETIKELTDAAKADPGSIKAGASGAGSIHHVNLLAFENSSGADFEFIPYDGSAPAQNAAMTGEVQLVITSVAEQAQLIRAGKLRPLAVLVEEPFEIGGEEIPSAFDTMPELTATLPIKQAIGFAVRADAPDNVKDTLRSAFDKAMQSDELKKFGKDQFYVLSGASGDEALEIMQSLQSNLSWALAENGLAVEDPADLGIPKP
ncbi:MAG: tripartite tricarboxylate transporter substrate binding protein [Spirochaetia bacterium]